MDNEIFLLIKKQKLLRRVILRYKLIKSLDAKKITLRFSNTTEANFSSANLHLGFLVSAYYSIIPIVPRCKKRSTDFLKYPLGIA